MNAPRFRWIAAWAGSAAIVLLLLVLRQTLRLASPGWLLAGLALAALPLLMASYELWRSRLTANLGHGPTIEAAVVHGGNQARLARGLFTMAGLLLLVLAAGRPQWGEQPREVQRRGIDVVFVVDLSRSMWATDVAPDRLSAAVRELERLLRSMDGDRVGLVVFAADSVVQSPLTSDYGAIRHYLQRVGPDDFSRQGTAIGRGIERATELLVGGNNPQFRRADSQIIVVVSDGEDLAGDPVESAARAREQGIDVFTVGVGTSEGSNIPLRGRDGTITGYVIDRQGNVVNTRLVSEQMQEIASTGGGEYLQLTSDGALTTFMEEVLSRYDEAALSSLLTLQYEERFVWFAAAGLLLLLAGRAPVRLPARTLLTVGLTSVLTACGDEPLFERRDPHVEQALELTVDNRASEALERLDRVAPYTRELPTFAYVDGWIHEQIAQYNSAQRQYLRALSAQDIPAQVRALTALGNVLMAQELWTAAIERYRRALVLDPGALDARTNLQIALLQLYPPCTVLDTTNEPNNDVGTATALPASSYEGDFVPPGVEEAPPSEGSEPETITWLACPNNTDWFSIPAVGGARISVDVRFSRLRPDNGGPPLPATVAPTSARIALLGPDGTTALAVDQGLTASASESVDAARIDRHLERVELPANYDPSLFVYLKVETDSPLEMNYTVRVTVEPPCHALEDEFESNDMRATARLLDPGEHQAFTCPGNDDWYRVTRNADQTLFVDVQAPSFAAGLPLRAEWYRGDDADPFQVDELLPSAAAHAELWSPSDLIPDGMTLEAPPEATPDQDVVLRLVNPNAPDDEVARGGYGISLYRYGPCPENDRFEENNTGETRRVLSPEEQPPLRYLRLCPADADWFEVTAPAEEPDEDEGSGATEPALRPFTVAATPLQPWQWFEGVLYDAATGQQLASGRSEAAGPDATPVGLALATELPRAVEARLAVGLGGAPGYYHLTMPELEQQQQQQQEQQQAEQDPDAEPEEGSAGEPQEGSSAPPEEGSAAEQEPENEEPEAPPAPELTEEELDRQELMDLLDSLEQNDTNLQVEQALRDQPLRPMEQQW